MRSNREGANIVDENVMHLPLLTIAAHWGAGGGGRAVGLVIPANSHIICPW